MKEELEGKLELTEGRLEDAERKVGAAAEAAKTGEEARRTLGEQVATLQAGKAAAEDTIAALNDELTTLRESAGATEESQLDKLCQVSKEAEGLRRRVKEMQAMKARLAEADAAVARLHEQVFAGEVERRALHNQVQELRGNIRVYVRVRPLLAGDAAPEGGDDEGDEDGEEVGAAGGGEELAVFAAPDGAALDIVPPPPRGTKEGYMKRDIKPLRFTFDTVFPPHANQADVFADVQHLVQSALDGYNVCLFSYGQTGSGKTFTMQGGAGEAAGLIPRSVRQILDTAGKLAALGWAYSLEVSFLEIYNEVVRDLLRVGSGGAARAGGAGGKAGGEDGAALTIHQDGDGAVEVPGLTRVAVADSDTIDVLLARAAKRRAVAATSMNELSSRSHQVFTLYIRGEHRAKGIAVVGTLNLCDLAGSERLAKSGAEGDRKKETAAINKSLSCLADVFSALAKKTPHVPYRNSKCVALCERCATLGTHGYAI